MNTYYSAFEVGKKYVEGLGLSMVNFTLRQVTNRVTIWVADNEAGYTHFVVQKLSPTQFIIWGYDNEYTQKSYTSFDYADVNTPQLDPNAPAGEDDET